MSQNKISFEIKPNLTCKKIVPQAVVNFSNYTYHPSQQIGLGYSSKVYLGKNIISNQPIAIKAIEYSKQDELGQKLINDQISVLQKISQNHPKHLLQLFDVVKTNDMIYIVTEFCEGKDVAKLLRKKKKLTQIQAQSIMKQLLQAYRQMHALGIVHRDLKLANVFIKQGNAKLADFGFAIYQHNPSESFDYNVGSPYYMAPQALKSNQYSAKSDIWALGVMAYQMIYGKLPWKQKYEKVQYDKIVSSKIQDIFDKNVPLTPLYKQFITSCLQISLQERASPEYVTAFQWPLAEKYIQGAQTMQNQNRVSNSTKSSNFSANIPRQVVTCTNLDQLPFRRKEEALRIQTNFKLKQVDQKLRQVTFVQPLSAKTNNILDQLKNKTTTTKPQFPLTQRYQKPQQLLMQQSSQKPQSTKILMQDKKQYPLDIQNAILGQIHYCRFLNNLYRQLQEVVCLPEGYLLRYELSNKTIRIMQGLKQLSTKAISDNTHLNSQKFVLYKGCFRWRQLQQLIQYYYNSFKEHYIHESIVLQVDEQVAKKCVKFMKNDLVNNFSAIEHLIYYIQLRQMENKDWLAFSTNSKIQLLANIDFTHKQNISRQLCDRIKFKLSILEL